jgi:ArsR family transcriptional regulator
MLDVRPLCVCEIDAVLDIAISTTSSHLKLMKSAGFIKSKKDGRWVIYYLAENEILTEMLLKTKELLKNDIQYLSDIEKINSISRESCKIR